jgi:hypothetical protein
MTKIDLREHSLVAARCLSHDVVLTNLLVMGFQAPRGRCYKLAIVQESRIYSCRPNIFPRHLRVSTASAPSGNNRNNVVRRAKHFAFHF